MKDAVQNVDYFTFHDVSINTGFSFVTEAMFLSLHSTMFLLIQVTLYLNGGNLNFTFHDVSINTRMQRTLYGVMRLYIPRCFY